MPDPSPRWMIDGANGFTGRLVAALPEGGRVRRDGRLETIPLGSLTRTIVVEVRER